MACKVVSSMYSANSIIQWYSVLSSSVAERHIFKRKGPAFVTNRHNGHTCSCCLRLQTPIAEWKNKKASKLYQSCYSFVLLIQACMQLLLQCQIGFVLIVAKICTICNKFWNGLIEGLFSIYGWGTYLPMSYMCNVSHWPRPCLC